MIYDSSDCFPNTTQTVREETTAAVKSTAKLDNQRTVALCKVIVVEPGTDSCDLRLLPAGVLGLHLRGEPGEESD